MQVVVLRVQESSLIPVATKGGKYCVNRKKNHRESEKIIQNAIEITRVNPHLEGIISHIHDQLEAEPVAPKGAGVPSPAMLLQVHLLLKMLSEMVP